MLSTASARTAESRAGAARMDASGCCIAAAKMAYRIYKLYKIRDQERQEFGKCDVQDIMLHAAARAGPSRKPLWIRETAAT
jgi:hypothetical protein